MINKVNQSTPEEYSKKFMKFENYVDIFFAKNEIKLIKNLEDLRKDNIYIKVMDVVTRANDEKMGINRSKKQNYIFLPEYGRTNGLGIANNGIRLYENSMEYWIKKKTEAYQTIGIISSNSEENALNFETRTQRQVMTTAISDELKLKTERDRLMVLVAERASQTNVLDIFKVNKALSSSIPEFTKFINEVYPNTTVTVMEEFNHELINIKYETLLEKNGKKHGNKFIFLWMKSKRINDDHAYMAFSNFTRSSIIGGDDVLSQAISLSTNFPFLLFHNSSHGTHVRRIMDLISPVKETQKILEPIKKNDEINTNFEKRMRSYERTTKGISKMGNYAIVMKIKKKLVGENGNTLYHYYVMSNKLPRDKLNFLKFWFNQYLKDKQLINYNIFTPNNDNKSAFDLFIEQQANSNENLSNNSNYKDINDFNNTILERLSFPVLHNWLQTTVSMTSGEKCIEQYLTNKKRWNETPNYYKLLIDEWTGFRDWVITNKNISKRIPDYLHQLGL